MLKRSLVHLSKPIFLTFLGYLALLAVLALALPKAALLSASKISPWLRAHEPKTSSLGLVW